MGGKARTLETRRILAEIFKRLAVDIGEEVATSAQDGLKQATGFLRSLGRKKPAE